MTPRVAVGELAIWHSKASKFSSMFACFVWDELANEGERTHIAPDLLVI